jgi:hypothetical protein
VNGALKFTVPEAPVESSFIVTLESINLRVNIDPFGAPVIVAMVFPPTSPSTRTVFDETEKVTAPAASVTI